MVHTRVHLTITPANPFLACSACGKRAEEFHDGRCGEECHLSEGPLTVFPCGHRGGYDNLCASWGPVDGCRCAAAFGDVPHPAVLP